MAEKLTVPDQSVAVLDSAGRMTPVWYQFFVALARKLNTL